MTRKRYFAYIGIVLALMASAARPQARTGQDKKSQSPTATASQVAPQPSDTTEVITGSGTAGQIVKWTGARTAANSVITESASGNVGIGTGLGTAAPGSKLTVRGMIETTLGGYKFPDGTIQTTAFSGKVFTDATLKGNGTAATPLGLVVPLSLTGDATQMNLLTLRNTGVSGTGLLTVGGDGDINNGAGAGLVAAGGRSNQSDGGLGLLSQGGLGVDHDGGAGGIVIGGEGRNAAGGEGLRVTGGSGSGAGHTGGAGLLVFAGAGANGAKDGLAGDFRGDVNVIGGLAVSGNLIKGGGSFKIDHPLDPEHKYLYHSFVESPDMMNIYNGTVTTDGNGEAIVILPDWFEALNQDFRYQLTVIGTFAQAIVADEVKGNRFTVKTNAPSVKVSWQVTGIRHDAYANKHRIPVEEQKPEDERGLYLHPDAFNQPETKSVQVVKFAPRLEKMNATGERANQSSQPR